MWLCVGYPTYPLAITIALSTYWYCVEIADMLRRLVEVRSRGVELCQFRTSTMLSRKRGPMRFWMLLKPPMKARDWRLPASYALPDLKSSRQSRPTAQGISGLPASRQPFDLFVAAHRCRLADMSESCLALAAILTARKIMTFIARAAKESRVCAVDSGLLRRLRLLAMTSRRLGGLVSIGNHGNSIHSLISRARVGDAGWHRPIP